MADEDEAGKNAGGEGSERRPLETLVLLMNGLLMLVVAWFQYDIHKKFNSKMDLEDVVRADMQKDMDGKAIIPGEAVGDMGILFPLESFTANLAQGDGPRRFIRLNTVLKFSNESNEEEFKARKPQIRDAIINTLNVKRPEDLLDFKGKLRLKEDLKAAINTFLIDGEVTDIYYVGFQIN